ncbi:MAG: DUF2569 domain-containing protein [Nitrososphaera sp.]|nr:DUF2569 domain-containing protein [Nitrososphaera sp.]
MADDGPLGLGGWLILPIIGLLLTPLFAAEAFLSEVMPLFEAKTWTALTTPGLPAYDPRWAPSLIFAAVSNLVLLVGPIGLLLLLFKKKRNLPKLVIAFYIFNFIAVGIDLLLTTTFIYTKHPNIANANEIVSEVVVELGRAFLLALIWVPYFLVSQRVTRTFVN